MAATPLRSAGGALPVWKGGFKSPFAGEGERMAKRARMAVERRREGSGKLQRALTVEEAIALRHDQTKGQKERKELVKITLPDDLSTLPDQLTTRPDGTLIIKNFDMRTRVFSALYRDLLTRYELILLLEKDIHMKRADFVEFSTAVKRLPVPKAGPPSSAEVEALDRWYRQTSERRAAKQAAEAEQEQRHFMGHKGPQPQLTPEPFPPQAAIHFKEGETMAPVVHVALREKFLAVTRLPQFRHMPGLPFFANRHKRSKGQTVLIGIPQFRQDTVAAFVKALRRSANKAPRDVPPVRSQPGGQASQTPEKGKAKRLILIGSMLRGRLLDPAALPELVTLPELETLQGQIVGQIAAASGSNLVGALQQATAAGQYILQTLSHAGGADLVGKLEGYRQTLESDGQDDKAQ